MRGKILSTLAKRSEREIKDEINELEKKGGKEALYEDLKSMVDELSDEWQSLRSKGSTISHEVPYGKLKGVFFLMSLKKKGKIDSVQCVDTKTDQSKTFSFEDIIESGERGLLFIDRKEREKRINHILPGERLNEHSTKIFRVCFYYLKLELLITANREKLANGMSLGVLLKESNAEVVPEENLEEVSESGHNNSILELREIDEHIFLESCSNASLVSELEKMEKSDWSDEELRKKLLELEITEGDYPKIADALGLSKKEVDNIVLYGNREGEDVATPKNGKSMSGKEPTKILSREELSLLMSSLNEVNPNDDEVKELELFTKSEKLTN